MQAEFQRRKDEAKGCRWPIERELCYQKIKLAYDAEVVLGGFELEDAEVCEQYKAEFDRKYLQE